MRLLNDSEVFTIVRQILLDGFAAGGFTDTLQVKQKYQPQLGGMPLEPTIYLYKLTGSNYGFSHTKGIRNTDDFTGITTQMKTPSFQVSALAHVDPNEDNPLSPSDYVEFAAAILNMPNTLLVLKNNGIGIERVKEIRDSYFLDDKDLYEQSPSFDFVLSYQKEYTSTIPKVDHIVGDIYPVLDPFTPPPPPEDTRYFALNETTRYATIPTLNISSRDDFAISVDVLLNARSGDSMIFASGSGYSIYCYAGSDGALYFNLDGAGLSLPASTIKEEILTAVLISRVGGAATLECNGVAVTETATGAGSVGMLYKYDAGFELQGIIANLEISINGTPVRSYAIDDNSNTLVDSVGGNDGAVINGIDADWGEFKEIPEGWQGENLSVPPWESEDQILLVAP
ncbi:MAG: hypothetical protein GY886_08495 [Gammaproteobacteria bacterium]|nr:hypothetical protein [Gammaproteobacteria bacterium]